MPGPLEGLKKATSIGPDAPIGTAPLRSALDNGVQGLLGAFGLGDSDNLANGIGGLASMAIPFGMGKMRSISQGPHPAITELIKPLGSEPTAVDPLKILTQDKIGGFQVPHRAQIVPPEGFELPEGSNPWIARDPELSNQRVLRLNGTINPQPPVKPAQGLLRGFESKFSNPF